MTTTAASIEVLAIFAILFSFVWLVWTQRSFLLSLAAIVSAIVLLPPLMNYASYFGIPCILLIISLILKTLYRAWTERSIVL